MGRAVYTRYVPENTNNLEPINARITPLQSVRLPQPNAGLRWRPAANDDLPNIISLVNAANKLDDPSRVVVAADMGKAFATKEPERNTVIAHDENNRAVAYGFVLEPSLTSEALSIETDFFVHPDRRGEGIETALLKWQEARVKQLFSTRTDTVRAWWVTGVAAANESGVTFLEDNGFRKERSWLAMHRELSTPINKPRLSPEIRITTPDGHSEETRLAYNDSFQDHWGSEADTAEDWQRREARSDYRSDLSFIALGPTADGDEEAAGLVVSFVSPEKWENRGGPFVYIHLMGVRRAWRGHGIATALLNHALQSFKAAGFKSAELTVDATNPTGALHVYEKVGFTPTNRHHTYVKEY